MRIEIPEEGENIEIIEIGKTFKLHIDVARGYINFYIHDDRIEDTGEPLAGDCLYFEELDLKIKEYNKSKNIKK